MHNPHLFPTEPLKGHLLQAKRALIESQLTPFYFSVFDFSLQNRVADAIGETM